MRGDKLKAEKVGDSEELLPESKYACFPKKKHC